MSYLALVDPSRMQRPRRRQLAQLVRLLPVGGLAPWQARVPDGDHRAPPEGLGAVGLRRGEARTSERQRLRIAFGCDGAGWDEEKVLERYELLSEAGLLGDARNGSVASADPVFARPLPRLRHPMLGDQLHVLASAIGELQALASSASRWCSS